MLGLPLWWLNWILFNSMFLFWQPVYLVRFRPKCHLPPGGSFHGRQ